MTAAHTETSQTKTNYPVYPPYPAAPSKHNLLSPVPVVIMNYQDTLIDNQNIQNSGGGSLSGNRSNRTLKITDMIWNKE